MSEITWEELQELIREVEQKQAERKRLRKHPYTLDLIRALWPYGERGHWRVDVIDKVWRLRNDASVTRPSSFENTVQAAYNYYCSASNVFVAREADLADALFYPVGRKGSGRWAVDRERAGTWLKRKKLEP
jgi:hypothetical protein